MVIGNSLVLPTRDVIVVAAPSCMSLTTSIFPFVTLFLSKTHHVTSLGTLWSVFLSLWKPCERSFFFSLYSSTNHPNKWITSIVDLPGINRFSDTVVIFLSSELFDTTSMRGSSIYLYNLRLCKSTLFLYVGTKILFSLLTRHLSVRIIFMKKFVNHNTPTSPRLFHTSIGKPSGPKAWSGFILLSAFAIQAFVLRDETHNLGCRYH